MKTPKVDHALKTLMMTKAVTKTLGGKSYEDAQGGPCTKDAHDGESIKKAQADTHTSHAAKEARSGLEKN